MSLGSPAAVSVRGLRKHYGPLQALAGVDLEVAAGEVFALLGPNGAGKTTLVEILEGYRRRSGGEASVLGVDPGRGDRRWRSRLGIVLQSTAIFDELTVEEVVKHFAGFYSRSLPVERVIQLVGLNEKRRSPCRLLSGGQKRRVDLALGLVGDPELLFLDEPTTGLDPEARRRTWQVIRDFASLGKTVILTTHYLEEAEALAGRVGVIVAGELLAVAPPDQHGGRDRAVARVSFQAEGPLRGCPLPEAGLDVVQEGNTVTLLTEQPTEVVARLASWAVEAGAGELPGLTVTRPSLEDIYLAMVRRAGGDAGGEVVE